MPILCYGNMSNLQKNLHIVRSLQNFTSFFTYNHQFLYMVSKHKHCGFFLMHDINLFLPIEKVCSKLNFPLRQRPNATASVDPPVGAQRLSLTVPCFNSWCVLVMSSDYTKRSVNIAPYERVHSRPCSPVLRAGLQVTHFPEVNSYVQNWFHQEQDACTPLNGAQSNAAAAGRA